MIDLLAGALGSVKTASDIVQTMLKLKTDTAVTAKAIELQSIILDIHPKLLTAQTDYATAARRICELEAEIAKFKDWSHDKERYELYELAPGTLTYRVKPAMQGGEPTHDLCPKCYQNNVKSILQYSGISVDSHKTLTCVNCNAILKGERIPQFAEVAPGRSRMIW